MELTTAATILFAAALLLAGCGSELNNRDSVFPSPPADIHPPAGSCSILESLPEHILNSILIPILSPESLANLASTSRVWRMRLAPDPLFVTRCLDLPHRENFQILVDSWIELVGRNPSLCPVHISHAHSLIVMNRFWEMNESERLPRICLLLDRVFDRTFADVAIACMISNPDIAGISGLNRYQHTIDRIRSVVESIVRQRVKTVVRIPNPTLPDVIAHNLSPQLCLGLFQSAAYAASKRLAGALEAANLTKLLLDERILWNLLQCGIRFNIGMCRWKKNRFRLMRNPLLIPHLHPYVLGKNLWFLDLCVGLNSFDLIQALMSTPGVEADLCRPGVYRNIASGYFAHWTWYSRAFACVAQQRFFIDILLSKTQDLVETSRYGALWYRPQNCILYGHLALMLAQFPVCCVQVVYAYEHGHEDGADLILSHTDVVAYMTQHQNLFRFMAAVKWMKSRAYGPLLSMLQRHSVFQVEVTPRWIENVRRFVGTIPPWRTDDISVAEIRDHFQMIADCDVPRTLAHSSHLRSALARAALCCMP